MRWNFVALLLLASTPASANFLSDTGVELPDKGSYCDVTSPGPHRIVEFDYWTTRKVCTETIPHRFGRYFQACNVRGTVDSVDLWILPKVDAWNVSLAFHDDLLKHEMTHSVPGCRNWHE